MNWDAIPGLSQAIALFLGALGAGCFWVMRVSKTRLSWSTDSGTVTQVTLMAQRIESLERTLRDLEIRYAVDVQQLNRALDHERGLRRASEDQADAMRHRITRLEQQVTAQGGTPA